MTLSYCDDGRHSKPRLRSGRHVRRSPQVTWPPVNHLGCVFFFRDEFDCVHLAATSPTSSCVVWAVNVQGLVNTPLCGVRSGRTVLNAFSEIASCESLETSYLQSLFLELEVVKITKPKRSINFRHVEMENIRYSFSLTRTYRTLGFIFMITDIEQQFFNFPDKKIYERSFSTGFGYLG